MKKLVFLLCLMTISMVIFSACGKSNNIENEIMTIPETTEEPKEPTIVYTEVEDEFTEQLVNTTKTGLWLSASFEGNERLSEVSEIFYATGLEISQFDQWYAENYNDLDNFKVYIGFLDTQINPSIEKNPYYTEILSIGGGL